MLQPTASTTPPDAPSSASEAHGGTRARSGTRRRRELVPRARTGPTARMWSTSTEAEVLRGASSRIASALTTTTIGAIAVTAVAHAAEATGPQRSEPLIGSALFLGLLFALRRVNAARLVIRRDHLEVVNPLRTEVVDYTDISGVEVSPRGLLTLSLRDGRSVVCVGVRGRLRTSSAACAANRLRAAIADSRGPRPTPQARSGAHVTHAWIADAALACAVACLAAALVTL